MSLANISFVTEDDNLRIVDDIVLENPEDIIGVVDALNKKYETDHSEEATVWREVMAGFEKEKSEADTDIAIYEESETFDYEHPELPEFLQEILDDWRYTCIDDETPFPLLEAYLRFGTAWEAWYSVGGFMYGRLYSEQLERWDKLGFLIDRKLHNSKNVDYLVDLMSLYRLLIPGFIGGDISDTKREIEYERKWNKYVAEDIVRENSPLTCERAILLLRTREDNSRLPAAISKYIRSKVPAFLKQERERLISDPKSDATERAKDYILWLEAYLQWIKLENKGIIKVTPEGSEIVSLLLGEIENIQDLNVLYLYSQLLVDKCKAYVNYGEYKIFYGKILDRLQNIVRTQETQPSKVKGTTDIFNSEEYKKAIKAISEEFTLGAIYLDYIFYSEMRDDIYTYFINQHNADIAEEEDYENGWGDIFPSYW